MDGILPVVAGTSGAFAVTAVLYKLIRPLFHIRVNCWFCNSDTVVPYGSKDSWDCPSCDQYNGFNKDGGYNKPIPAQYDDSLNYPVTAQQQNEPKHMDSGNVLCTTCNRNQLLKVKQLANFVPYNEQNFEDEVALYRQQLENTYRLCRVCHVRVKQEINKQDQILQKKIMGDHLRSVSSDNISMCSDHFICQMSTPLHIKCLRLVAIVSAITLFIINLHHVQVDSHTFYISFQNILPALVIRYMEVMHTMAYMLVFLGLFSGIAAIFLFGKERLNLIDAVCSFTWLGLLFLHSTMTNQLGPYLLQQSDRYTLQTILSLCCVGLTVASAVWKRTQRRYRKNKRKRSRRSVVGDTSGMASTSSVSPDPSPEPSLAGDIDTVDNKHAINTAPKVYIDNTSKLETMSLGPPGQRKRGTGAFGSFLANTPCPSSDNFVSSTTGSPDVLSSLRRNRPLISPARFKATEAVRNSPTFGKNSPSLINAQNTPSASRQLFVKKQGYGFNSQETTPSTLLKRHGFNLSKQDMPSENNIMNGSLAMGPDMDSDNNSTNSSSSECPVDTTCLLSEDGGNNTKRSVLTRVLFGMSIGLNIAVGLYYFVDYKKLFGNAM